MHSCFAQWGAGVQVTADVGPRGSDLEQPGTPPRPPWGAPPWSLVAPSTALPSLSPRLSGLLGRLGRLFTSHPSPSFLGVPQPCATPLPPASCQRVPLIGDRLRSPGGTFEAPVPLVAGAALVGGCRELRGRRVNPRPPVNTQDATDCFLSTSGH